MRSVHLRLLYPLVLTAGIWLANARAAAVEDWNFTPEDYSALRAGGGDLRLGEDSAWLPKVCADNLIKTLRYALDSQRSPRVTDGVNVKDFYHGHVICKAPVPDELYPLISEYSKAERSIHPLPINGDELRKASLNELVEAEIAYERVTGKFLQTVLERGFCPEAGILYHTFEFAGGPPDLKVGDPLRNIFTPLMGSPRPFQVPDPYNASSYTQDYLHLSQLAFLIDAQGSVHAVVGTTANLARVVGEYLN